MRNLTTFVFAHKKMHGVSISDVVRFFTCMMGLVCLSGLAMVGIGNFEEMKEDDEDGCGSHIAMCLVVEFNKFRGKLGPGYGVKSGSVLIRTGY